MHQFGKYSIHSLPSRDGDDMQATGYHMQVGRVARVRRLDGQRKKNRAVQRSTRKGSQVRRKPRSPTCRPQTKIHADGATQQCRRQVAECTQNWSKKYNPERKGEKANGNSLSTDHLCFPVVFVCQRTKKTCSVLKADSSA